MVNKMALVSEAIAMAIATVAFTVTASATVAVTAAIAFHLRSNGGPLLKVQHLEV